MNFHEYFVAESLGTRKNRLDFEDDMNLDQNL